MIITITRYGKTRHVAIYADGELLTLTVYLKGARSLCRFLCQHLQGVVIRDETARPLPLCSGATVPPGQEHRKTQGNNTSTNAELMEAIKRNTPPAEADEVLLNIFKENPLLAAAGSQPRESKERVCRRSGFGGGEGVDFLQRQADS